MIRAPCFPQRRRYLIERRLLTPKTDPNLDHPNFILSTKCDSSSSASDSAVTKLPQEVTALANVNIPRMYDFAKEREIVSKYEDLEKKKKSKDGSRSESGSGGGFRGERLSLFAR